MILPGDLVRMRSVGYPSSTDEQVQIVVAVRERDTSMFEGRVKMVFVLPLHRWLAAMWFNKVQVSDAATR